MGYTNYWKQDKDFTDSEWKAVKKEYEYIKDIVMGNIEDCSEHDEEIVFNGGIIDGERLSCETFMLFKNARTKPNYGGEDLAFNFCKTRQMPYDLPIWHLLTFAYHNTNAITSISRDRG
jgi:hypothetical protein